RVVVVTGTWNIRGRPGCGADVRQAAHLTDCRTRGQRLVQPVRVVEYLLLLPEGSDDATRAPIVRSAEPHFMALVGVAQRLMPGGDWREAPGLSGRAAFGAVALVVIGVHTARVI